MRSLLAQLLRDDRGFVVSAELILVATIAVIGCLVGLAAFRDAITLELGDTAGAVGALNQSYEEQYSGEYFTQDPDTNEVTVEFEAEGITVTGKFFASSYSDASDAGGGENAAGIEISDASVLAEGEGAPDVLSMED